jgi:phosphate-selective porin
VSLGGYIQTQYTRISMDGGDPRDRVLFRRIMLWAQSDLGEHWSAEVEADVAPATLGERILVRDAYLRYSGLRDGHFIVTLGNQKMPFSRSALTGASKRGFVERPVTGERPFGAPGARSR